MMRRVFDLALRATFAWAATLSLLSAGAAPARAFSMPALGLSMGQVFAVNGTPNTGGLSVEFAPLWRAGERTREKIGSGWGYIIGSAAAVGKLCHGPPRGNKVTFVRTDQWVEWKQVDEGEALADAYRRYVATYGPAGPREFAGWFGIKPAEARPLLGSVELEQPPERKRQPGPLRLLPEYDCYVMGFRERDQLVPEKVRGLVKAHPKGRFEGIAAVPTLLIDGVVAGIWRRAKKGKKVEIAVEPAQRLSSEERSELEAEAERIGSFLGAEPTLRVGRLEA